MTSKVAIPPRRYLSGLEADSFVRLEQVPGSSLAARSALSRAAKRGELRRVGRGLYFKGRETKYGLTGPTSEAVVREVFGDSGVGPAGISAASALGLTTQVPAQLEISFVGPLPTFLLSIGLHKRNNLRRMRLRYLEIALLEVLRGTDLFIEQSREEVVAVIRALVEDGEVRIVEIESVLVDEPPRVRAEFVKLAAEIQATDAHR